MSYEENFCASPLKIFRFFISLVSKKYYHTSYNHKSFETLLTRRLDSIKRRSIGDSKVIATPYLNSKTSILSLKTLSIPSVREAFNIKLLKDFI